MRWLETFLTIAVCMAWVGDLAAQGSFPGHGVGAPGVYAPTGNPSPPTTVAPQPSVSPQGAMRGASVNDFQFSQPVHQATYEAPDTSAPAAVTPPEPTASPTLAPLSDPIPLAPKGQRNPGSGSKSQTTTGAFFTVFGSLAIVLGLFFVLVWFSRKANGKSGGPLPKEVIEVLGHSPLAPRQTVHVVRFGPKLLLLSVTSTGSEALAEITDPEEVDRLSGLCKQQQPDSITESFRHVLSGFSADGDNSRSWFRRGGANAARSTETRRGAEA